MEHRKPISRDVVEGEKFLRLPKSAQRLYFFLVINSSNRGHIVNAKEIVEKTESFDSDLLALLDKKFIWYDHYAGVYTVCDWMTHGTF